jgi:hypothetical protein
MRNACSGMLLILIIVAATMLSGCTGGPASSAAVTGTPVVASPTPVPVAMKSGSLFDTSKLQWFEYRRTTTGGDEPAISDVRFDYTTTAIGDITVRDDRITMKMTSPDMTVVMDKYYDPVSNVQVGSRVKTVSSSASLSDLGVQASDLYGIGNIADACTTGNWPLKSLGTDVVTIDGTSYTCTKYAIGDSGEHGNAWVSDSVPVPVKIESVSDGGAITTWELFGRG